MTKVLVADDEENILHMLGRALALRNHTVTTARTVLDAKESIAKEEPDMIIADLRFSPVDKSGGLRLIDFAKARNPATQVILMTAHGSPEVEREAYEKGAAFYFEKPIDLRVFFERLTALEAEKKLSRGPAARPVEAPRPPAAPPPSPKMGSFPVPLAATDPARGNARKILLVDDSKTSLFLAHTILRKGPYTITTACNGKEAVESALLERPDLILMDVVMPEMDGFEALRCLRENEATKSIPVILVTTRGEEVNRKTGYDLGCSDYVTKPVNAAELLAKVQAFVGEA